MPVTSLKNWMYCRRQVYFAEGLGLPAPPTSKMLEGRLAHDEVERLEVRRAVARYGCQDRNRVFRPQMESEELGISGCPDLLLVGDAAVAVVEFKLTGASAREGDWLQLAAYAALSETDFGRPVDLVIVYRIPDGGLEARHYTPAWRQRLETRLAEVRNCIGRRIDPGPAAEPAKCVPCPYQNFCADVW